MNQAQKEAYLREYSLLKNQGKPFFPYAVAHPRGGRIDVTAPLPPHMQQSWSLLGLDAARYDPIENAPEE